MSTIKLDKNQLGIVGLSIAFNFTDNTFASISVDEENNTVNIIPNPLTFAEYLHDIFWIGSKGVQINEGGCIFLGSILKFSRSDGRTLIEWFGDKVPPEILIMQKVVNSYDKLRSFW